MSHRRGPAGAILSTEEAAPEIGVFRLIFGVLVVISVLATATTLFIHRFPPHEPAIETEPLPVLTGAPVTEMPNA